MIDPSLPSPNATIYSVAFGEGRRNFLSRITYVGMKSKGAIDDYIL